MDSVSLFMKKERQRLDSVLWYHVLSPRSLTLCPKTWFGSNVNPLNKNVVIQKSYSTLTRTTKKSSLGSKDECHCWSLTWAWRSAASSSMTSLSLTLDHISSELMVSIVIGGKMDFHFLSEQMSLLKVWRATTIILREDVHCCADELQHQHICCIYSINGAWSNVWHLVTSRQPIWTAAFPDITPTYYPT